jgi:GT2 family glycosyltransferase
MNQSWGEVGLKNPSFLFGANALYRRAAISKAGYYDEVFRTNGEDVDMCSKLRRHGYDLVYEPRAFAYHHRKDDVASVLRMNWQHWRHPYVFYKPHQSLRDVFDFLKIMCGLVWRNFKDDLAERDFARAGISLLSIFNIPFRELRSYFDNPKAQVGEAPSNPAVVRKAEEVG